MKASKIQRSFLWIVTMMLILFLYIATMAGALQMKPSIGELIWCIAPFVAVIVMGVTSILISKIQTR